MVVTGTRDNLGVAVGNLNKCHVPSRNLEKGIAPSSTIVRRGRCRLGHDVHKNVLSGRGDNGSRILTTRDGMQYVITHDIFSHSCLRPIRMELGIRRHGWRNLWYVGGGDRVLWLGQTRCWSFSPILVLPAQQEYGQDNGQKEDIAHQQEAPNKAGASSLLKHQLFSLEGMKFFNFVSQHNIVPVPRLVRITGRFVRTGGPRKTPRTAGRHAVRVRSTTNTTAGSSTTTKVFVVILVSKVVVTIMVRVSVSSKFRHVQVIRIKGRRFIFVRMLAMRNFNHGFMWRGIGCRIWMRMILVNENNARIMCRVMTGRIHVNFQIIIQSQGSRINGYGTRFGHGALLRFGLQHLGKVLLSILRRLRILLLEHDTLGRFIAFGYAIHQIDLWAVGRTDDGYFKVRRSLYALLGQHLSQFSFGKLATIVRLDRCCRTSVVVATTTGTGMARWILKLQQLAHIHHVVTAVITRRSTGIVMLLVAATRRIAPSRMVVVVVTHE
mmetsp:Transcript_22366/g.42465  ORF Transcript_22366/g.42465 Transcript_22366/m.42465 type:complete len:494 (+) Transcript_22366:1463-2944(+)